MTGKLIDKCIKYPEESEDQHANAHHEAQQDQYFKEIVAVSPEEYPDP